MPDTSRRLAGIGGSAVNAVFALAGRLRAEGRDIVDLSVGEPDAGTPDHVRAAAIAAIEAGAGRYTAVDGMPALKAAIARSEARDGMPAPEPDDIVVGAGVKPLLFQALQALTGPGDGVAYALPAWASYEGMIRLAGGTPCPIDTASADGFRLDPDTLGAACATGARAVLLNWPGNPSGAVADPADLARMADVLRDYPEVWILADEIYRRILRPGTAFAPLTQIAPDLAGRTVRFDGVSKAHAMTGWRIGWAIGPRDAMDAMRVVVSQTAGSPPEVSQHAAIAALDGPQDGLAQRGAAYDRRTALVVDALGRIPGMEARIPDGAFYVLVDCSGYLARRDHDMRTDVDLGTHLLRVHGLATVPGSGFGAPGCLRLSVATSEALLSEAMVRLARAIGGPPADGTR